jgi:hypothetical protein
LRRPADPGAVEHGREARSGRHVTERHEQAPAGLDPLQHRQGLLALEVVPGPAQQQQLEALEGLGREGAVEPVERQLLQGQHIEETLATGVARNQELLVPGGDAHLLGH